MTYHPMPTWLQEAERLVEAYGTAMRHGDSDGSEKLKLLAHLTLRANPADDQKAETATSKGSFYELRLQRVLSVVQRYVPPGHITARQALSEIAAIVDPWPRPGDPREQHFPGAVVPPAQYARNVLGSCANWLETRSRASVSTMEFEGGVMRGYARDLRKIQALLERTEPPEPLTKAEIRDLSAMAFGAPSTVTYLINVCAPPVRAYEQCLARGERPRDPARSEHTVTARQMAEANGLPLRFDEQGRAYVSSEDWPPEKAGINAPLYVGRRSLANTLADPAQWALRPTLHSGATVTRVGTGALVLEGATPNCPKTGAECGTWPQCFDAGCKAAREEMRPGPVAYSTDYDTSGFRKPVTTMEEAITRQAPAAPSQAPSLSYDQLYEIGQRHGVTSAKVEAILRDAAGVDVPGEGER